MAVAVQNAESRDRAVLHLAVTHVGPGSPVQFQECVLEKFFRVEHSGRVAAKARTGTGIGRYLCKYISTAHAV